MGVFFVPQTSNDEESITFKLSADSCGGKRRVESRSLSEAPTVVVENAVQLHSLAPLFRSVTLEKLLNSSEPYFPCL